MNILIYLRTVSFEEIFLYGVAEPGEVSFLKIYVEGVISFVEIAFLFHQR